MLYLIIIPFIVGLFCLVLPKKLSKLREWLAIGGSLVTFYLTIVSFLRKPVEWTHNNLLLLKVDNLSGFILLAIGLFGVLIILYSLKYMAGKERLNEYYTYLLWTIGGACGAILTNNLILLLVFWGFLGLTLYLLIGIGGPEASAAAKKSFIIVGGSDALMILGVGIIWFLTRSFEMDKIIIPISGELSIIAFLTLVMAVFAKVGAMPLHTWIPDMAETAPTSVTAFLPASLDKLIGIYLLGRIALHLFQINNAMGLVLMLLGTFTLVASVMAALVQKEIRKLIAYLNISAAGYMVVAIATGNSVGIAGGLFYLLSTSIWTSCLFLSCGAVENRIKTTEFDNLGGLAKTMPITFGACLVAGLSISGVPPLNGFISKWMIYQGIIETETHSQGLVSRFWIIWLVAAIFGSALTLASFMKLIHSVFLGSPSPTTYRPAPKRNEVSFAMWMPMAILAVLCVIFGVFAYKIPLKNFILPAVPGVSFLGFWSPSLATLLIVIGIILGVIIYWIGNIKGLRMDTAYIGGEVISEDSRVTGVDFYDTIRDMGTFKEIYRKAEKKLFDIYDQGTRVVSLFTKGLKKIHTGVLTTYLIWVLIGTVIIFFTLVKG